MRTGLATILAIIGMLNIGHAQAQQWNDAVQYLDQNGAPNNDTTNFDIIVAGVSCPSGTPFKTFSTTAYAGCNSATGGLGIDLNQFARQSDLLALETQMTNFTATVSQLDQSIHAASLRANQGVAMSLAMAGVGDLQSDEHIAFSGNWGTFQGQNGGAVGIAYRLTDHVSVNGGFAGSFNGGTYGGRAGIRVGW